MNKKCNAPTIHTQQRQRNHQDQIIGLDDLKRLTSFFDVLMKIDQQKKREENNATLHQ